MHRLSEDTNKVVDGAVKWMNDSVMKVLERLNKLYERKCEEVKQ